MSYLYEMHYHTPSTSYCGNVSPMKAFPHYSKNGYSGVVVTDHYYKTWFDDKGSLSWDQKIDCWLQGYRDATEAASVYKLDIILGLELRFNDSLNDYLVYGVDEQLLTEHQELYDMTPKEFRIFADKHGLFFAQAHPFRSLCQPCEPKLLHGLEVFNGNLRHNNRNSTAEGYAQNNRLIMISGSDFHEEEDKCRGGVYFSRKPTDSRDMASLILSGGIEELRTTVD